MKPASTPEWVKAYGRWLYDRNGGSPEQPVPQTLYKYYRPERVHVLLDCSVRFTQRAAFVDDDRELRPEVAAFGTEEEITAFMRFDPWCQSLSPWLRDAVVRRILTVAGWQERIKSIAQSHMKTPDEFGIFCLCDQPNSNEMWKSYAAATGFVVAFDTTHAAFESLQRPGKLGKVTYSDEPIGTFLGSYGAEAFFRKRAKYEFECEWRSIRALHRLDRNGEHDGHPVFVSRFDPACITEILVRPDCSVRQQLDDLLTMDVRYRHVTLRPV